MVSVAELNRWLGEKAEEMGAYVLSETTGNKLLIEDGKVVEHGPTDQVFNHATDAYTRLLLESIPGKRRGPTGRAERRADYAEPVRD